MECKEFNELSIILKITNDVIDNIMEKALDEGGILHWCLDARPKYNNNADIKSVISNKGILILYDMENKTYELTKDKLILGLQQAMPYLDKVISGTNIDAASIDYDSADLIIQLALFNQLVYQ